MLEFGLASRNEVALELGSRLKSQRLLQLLSREELAARAGVSRGTVRNLELKGQASLDSLLRIVFSLGLATQLQPLFKLQIVSIADLERASRVTRLRAPKRRRT